MFPARIIKLVMQFRTILATLFRHVFVQELICSMTTAATKGQHPPIVSGGYFVMNFPLNCIMLGLFKTDPLKEAATELLSLLSEVYCTRVAPFFKSYLRQ